jgi:hypothetical protein
MTIVPITEGRRRGYRHPSRRTLRSVTMGKGNNSQKNDKKSMKPKQDKSKTAVKK